MRSTQKPTELAEHLFGLAWSQSNQVTDFEHVGRVLGNITLGLVNLSVGLRAIYMKLAELEDEVHELRRRSDRASSASKYQTLPPLKR